MLEPTRTIVILCIGVLIGAIPSLIIAWFGRRSEQTQVTDTIVQKAVQEYFEKFERDDAERHISTDIMLKQLLSYLSGTQDELPDNYN
jgi:hypothetical protein